MGVFGKLRRRRRVPAVDVSLTKDEEKRSDVSVKGTYVASLAFRFNGNFQPRYSSYSILITPHYLRCGARMLVVMFSVISVCLGIIFRLLRPYKDLFCYSVQSDAYKNFKEFFIFIPFSSLIIKVF